MSVCLVFAEIWNGDFTRRYTYDVCANKEIAQRKHAEAKLPAFSKLIYETWEVTQ